MRDLHVRLDDTLFAKLMQKYPQLPPAIAVRQALQDFLEGGAGRVEVIKTADLDTIISKVLRNVKVQGDTNG